MNRMVLLAAMAGMLANDGGRGIVIISGGMRNGKTAAHEELTAVGQAVAELPHPLPPLISEAAEDFAVSERDVAKIDAAYAKRARRLARRGGAAL